MKLLNYLNKRTVEIQKERTRIENENIQREELKKLLITARNMIIYKDAQTEDTHPIYLLMKALANEEFYRYVNKSISTIDPGRMGSFSVLSILPVSEKSKTNPPNNCFLYEDDTLPDSLKRKDWMDFVIESEITEENDEQIYLGYDAVLPWPWNASRLDDAIKGKSVSGDWKQNPNHRVDLLMPYGIAIVKGGNHSITKGILLNQGEITPKRIYDFSKIHDHIYTDGVDYFRSKDNSFYAKANSFNFAAIFAIGDLIVKNNNIAIKFHGKTDSERSQLYSK